MAHQAEIAELLAGRRPDAPVTPAGTVPDWLKKAFDREEERMRESKKRKVEEVEAPPAKQPTAQRRGGRRERRMSIGSGKPSALSWNCTRYLTQTAMCHSMASWAAGCRAVGAPHTRRHSGCG